MPVIYQRKGGQNLRPPMVSLFLAEHAIEFGARRGDLILHYRQKRLRIRQDDAVLEKLGAGRTAEGRLIGPPLIQRRYLDALFNAVELALGDIPADGEHLSYFIQAADGAIGVLGPDVDVLDELDFGIGRQERAIRIVSLARVVAYVETI